MTADSEAFDRQVQFLIQKWTIPSAEAERMLRQGVVGGETA